MNKTRLTLWRGPHAGRLKNLLAESWQKHELLISCAPRMEDYGFLKALPPLSDLRLEGTWTEAQRSEAEQAFAQRQARTDYPEQAVLGVFTSGSLGQPRLVLYSKKNIEASLSAIRELFEAKRIRKIFCYPQPFHTFGLILGYLHSMLYDAELVTPEGAYSTEAHTEWLKHVGPETLTLGAPTHFTDLAAYLEKNEIRPPRSYSAIVGGARVSQELWDRMQKKLQIEKPSVGYGASEASPGVTHLPPGVRPLEDGEIGRPLSSVNVEILAGQGLRFSGPATCLALIEKERLEFPKQILLADEVIARADGHWLFRGRLDLTLNRGGVKYSLESIEADIHRATGVPGVAVAVPDERLGSELAFLFQAPAANERSLRLKALDVLSKKYGLRFRGSYFRSCPALPLNPSAKVDRVEARRILSQDSRKLQYPVKVEALREVIPHRAPALWVNEVTWVDTEGGECRIKLDPSAHYYDAHGEIRESCCMEWMAQAHAFVAGCQYGEGMHTEKSHATRAFLVAMRSVKIDADFQKRARASQDSLYVHVAKTHQFGPISVIQGRICNDAGDCLAEGQLRVFAD